MTTPRDEATALLAEALRSLGDAYPIFRQRPTQNDLGGETWWAHEPLAHAILAASPILAADLEFAAAWRRVERALPDGWWFGGCQRYGGGWSAAAWGPAPDWAKAAEVGPTPTAALETLAEKLEATR